MEEILNVDLPGFKASYLVRWSDELDFSSLSNVKQVYGILFNNEGKILVVNTVGNWQVPGGKPGAGESFEETLVRESLEEADVEIEDITPLGYQRVSEIKDEDQGKEFQQLRFYAKIKNIKEPTIDPATGKIPERKFINPKDFLEYCPWGKIGQYIVNKAHSIFQKKQGQTLDFMKPLGDLLRFSTEINPAVGDYHPRKVNREYLQKISRNVKYIDLSEDIQEGLFGPNWNMLDRKRSNMRPILFLLLVGGLGRNPKEYVDLASMLESIHNGTLIHDDIEDNAEVRRGDEPIYVKYGLDTAVNSANALYFTPFIILKEYKDKFSNEKLIEAYESLIEHLNRVTWGQSIDILWHKNHKIPSTEEYFQMCCYKTGAIDRMVFSFAGVVCEVDKQTKNKLEDLGEELGIFLQIHDDFSDVCSVNRSLIGNKTIGNDISEGKKSLINILTIDRLESEDKKYFIKLLSERTHNKEKIRSALDFIEKSGSLKKSLEISKEKLIFLINESKNLLNEEYSSRFIAFLEAMQKDMENKYLEYSHGKNS
jgi:geranylgeranyl diphosphate synthase, type I